MAVIGHVLPRTRVSATKGSSPRARRRIALLGNFGTANTGNESTLAAMIEALERVAPGSDVTCVCYVPERVEREHGLPAVALNPAGPRNLLFRILNRASLRLPLAGIRLVRMLAFLRGVDVLIVPGTGALDDFGVPPFDWPFHLFKWCLGARLLGVKVGFVSIGAGPIANPISRWFLKVAAAGAAYRSFRDEHSKAFVGAMGLDTRADAVYPDLVFSMPAPRTGGKRGGPRCVGVGVMGYRGWDPRLSQSEAVYSGYLAKMCRFVLWLHAEGWNVRLFGGDAVDDVALFHLVRMIGAKAEGSTEMWLSATRVRTSAELLEEIAQTDRVVASRFHNVLWSLVLGKPVISIGYADKNKYLMQDMGFGQYCHHIDSFDVESLVADFREIGLHEDELVGRLAARIAVRRTALAEQEGIIASDLLDRVSTHL